jgi:hypothetical protein
MPPKEITTMSNADDDDELEDNSKPLEHETAQQQQQDGDDDGNKNDENSDSNADNNNKKKKQQLRRKNSSMTFWSANLYPSTNDDDDENNNNNNKCSSKVLCNKRCLVKFYNQYEFLILVVIAIVVAKLYPPLGAEYLQPQITSTWIAVFFIFSKSLFVFLFLVFSLCICSSFDHYIILHCIASLSLSLSLSTLYSPGWVGIKDGRIFKGIPTSEIQSLCSAVQFWRRFFRCLRCIDRPLKVRLVVRTIGKRFSGRLFSKYDDQHGISVDKVIQR